MAAVSAEQERTADLRSKESEVSSSSGLEAGGKQGDTADTEAGVEEPAPAPAPATPLDCSVSPPPALAAVDSLQESVAKVSPCSAAVLQSPVTSTLQLLFMNFKWARDIPSFQQLNTHNQKRLLQSSWSQLLVLSLAQLPGTCNVAADTRGRDLVRCCRFAGQAAAGGGGAGGGAGAGAALRHGGERGAAGAGRDRVHLPQGARPLQPARGGAGRRRAGGRGHGRPLVTSNLSLPLQLQIEVLQDQTGLMLQEYCSSRHQAASTSSKVRLNRLLLTLLPVTAIDKQLLETAFFQRTLGTITVDKLVMDLLQQ